MDDDEFNYEPDDLNSEPKDETSGKAEEKNIFDNEEKEKIYKFEDIEEIDAGEQKRILDEIQAKNAGNNKKEESKKEDNIFDLISEHNNNGGNNEQINEVKQDNTNENDIDIEKYLDNNVQIKKENELVSQEDQDMGFDDNIDELMGELNENDKEKDTKKQDQENGKKEDDIEEIGDIEEIELSNNVGNNVKNENNDKKIIKENSKSNSNKENIIKYFDNKKKEKEKVEEIKPINKPVQEIEQEPDFLRPVSKHSNHKQQKEEPIEVNNDFNIEDLLDKKGDEDNNDIFMTRQKNVIPQKKQQVFTPPPKENKPEKSNLSSQHTLPNPRKNKNKNEPISDFERAEEIYYCLKEEINQIVNSPETSNISILNRQNAKMLNIFSSLNDVLTILTEATKFKPLPTPKKKKMQNIDPSVNNEKIYNQYKNEYLILQKRKRKLSDKEYSDKLLNELGKIKEDKKYYTREIKSMRSEQKLSEIKLSRQMNFPTKAEISLKRVEMDYESMKKKYDVVVMAIEKNKQKFNENELKEKELKEFKEKLEKIAKEMYDITEFKDVSNENKKIKENEKKLDLLKKKIVVFESAREVNKKKYEAEIAKKEKEIYEMEQNKLRLLKKLKEENSKSEIALGKIGRIYEPILKMQQVQEEEKENFQNEEKNIAEIKPEENKSNIQSINKEEDNKENPINVENLQKNEKSENKSVHEDENQDNPSSLNRYPLPPVKEKTISRKPNFGSIKLNDLVQNNSNFINNNTHPPTSNNNNNSIDNSNTIKEKADLKQNNIEIIKKEELHIDNQNENDDNSNGIKEDIQSVDDNQPEEEEQEEKQITIEPEPVKQIPAFLEGFEDNEPQQEEPNIIEQQKNNNQDDLNESIPKLEESHRNKVNTVEDNEKDDAFNNLFKNPPLKEESKPKNNYNDLDDFDNLEEFVI